MSQLVQSFTKVLIIVFITSTIFLVACSAEPIEQFDRMISGVNQTASLNTQSTDSIILAGKVTDPATNKWLNDYLVIVFLNGEEVGRFISSLDKFENSGEGKHDGLFKVAFPNTYELTPETFFLRSDGDFMAVSTTPRYLYSWLGEMAPGSLIHIQVPDKQIEYAIKIMEAPVTELSEDYLARGQAQLTSTDQIVAPAIPEISEVGYGGAENGAQVESNSTVEPNSTVELDSTTESIMSQEVRWTRTLSGYYGNRYEVWERFVQPTIPGLSWNEFKEQVLIYNPQLVTDGNIFHTDKLYIIPELN
jgi:hypothetical protein